jgi:D-glycero-D-manno-heptose 1,7-bisphosphate phosphatase
MKAGCKGRFPHPPRDLDGVPVMVVRVTPSSDAQPMQVPETSPAIFLDLEGVIIERRPGRTDPPYSLRPGVEEGLRRMAQASDRLVALVQPAPAGTKRPRSVDFLDGVRAPMVRGGPELVFVACPHRPSDSCDCRTPGRGLIEIAMARVGLGAAGGWHISGDQESVLAGRAAGLRTIRIGPPPDDHHTAVHRADYEARDLLDAANWILVSSLGASVSAP